MRKSIWVHLPQFSGVNIQKYVKFHHLGFTSFRVDVTFDASSFFYQPRRIRWNSPSWRIDWIIIRPPNNLPARQSSHIFMFTHDGKKQQTHHLQKPTKNSSMMETLEVPHLRLPQFFSCFRFQAVHGLVVNISWVLPPIFCCWRTSLCGDRSLLPGCSTKQPRNTAPSS